MAKRIIFCADGTWNDAATHTNVYKLFKALNFTAEQCPIYDDGVGADGNTLLRLFGGAFGDGLDKKSRTVTRESLICIHRATHCLCSASVAEPTPRAALPE